MTKKNSPNGSEQFKLFHLQPQHADQTLGSVLRSLHAGTSWGQIQTWIRARHVQVNGNLCLDPARRVSGRDVIKLWREPLPKPVTADQLKLPYVDEHLLVVEKPAGITSVWHRQERQLPDRRRQIQPTLEELLSDALTSIIGPPSSGRSVKPPAHHTRSRGHTPRIAKGSGRIIRWPIYPVHRLDRDTSGLMLFARTRIAEQKLTALFRDHRIDRQYWAAVHGVVDSQTIRSILVRDRGDGLRGSRLGLTSDEIQSMVAADASLATEDEANDQPDDVTSEPSSTKGEEKGQLAVTHVEFVETVGSISLIRCRLETGRTHQIRIHLSELGHPLCGEKTYLRRRDGSLMDDRSQAPRQVLHAERLAFTHPMTGERLQFKMALPPELKNWLARFRQHAGDTQ